MEERFYIVAPFLLVVSVHFKTYRVHILLLLILLLPLIRPGIYEILVRGDMRKFYDYIYFPTHARFDNLALGVFCAYVCAFHRDVLQHPLFRQILPVATVLLLIAAVFTTASLNRYSQHPSLVAGVLGFSFTAAFWAAVLLCGETFRIFDRFGKGTMKLIAYLSYSMYLYHILVLNLTNNVCRGAVNGLGGVLLHAAVFALATLIAGGLSYLLIERYFLQLKHRLKHAPSALKGQPA